MIFCHTFFSKSRGRIISEISFNYKRFPKKSQRRQDEEKQCFRKGGEYYIPKRYRGMRWYGGMHTAIPQKIKKLKG